jgi:sarcosine oxidase, subunit beta
VVLGGGWPGGPFLLEEPAAVLADSIDGNTAQASRSLPALATAPLTDVWTGPVITTPDEMPVIGAVDDAPGMLVAGGTYSFTFAPVWADVLTALVSGERPRVDISPFTPARLATVS